MKPIASVALCLAFLGITALSAAAAPIGSFAVISPVNTNGSVGSLLSLDVIAYGNNQALFTFSNNNPVDPLFPGRPAITEVYFDDGALLGINANGILDDPAGGVDFEFRTSPTNPPGGANLSPPFETSAGYFSLDSDPAAGGGTADGIGPGESLGLVLDIKSGYSFADIWKGLGLGFSNPSDPLSIRIAVHIRGINGALDQSDTFVLVPVPGAVLLGMLGLGVAGIKLRRYA